MPKHQHPRAPIQRCRRRMLLQLSLFLPLLQCNLVKSQSCDIANTALGTIISVEWANYQRFYSSSTPALTTTVPPPLHVFQSEFFKLTLKDPKGQQRGQTADTPKVSDVYTRDLVGNEPFYVHKALLESLSPELAKHVNNDMREGREGEMKLSEVDEGTLIALLSWAYGHNYEA